jgi:transcriptional regulator with XRE-family HTH domain
MNANETWRSQTAALGAFIRTQRLLADLSLRELATITNVSNAYLSQIERGLHQPSVRVLRAIADALQVPTDRLLAEAGLLRQEPPAACRLEDPALTDEQRQALLSVYRSFLAGGD